MVLEPSASHLSKTLWTDDIDWVSRDRLAVRPHRIAETIVHACAALGVLGGFLWGWHHQAHPTCENHGTAAEALNRCTSTALSAIATHWGLALGGGVAIGGGVGVLLAITLARRLVPH